MKSYFLNGGIIGPTLDYSDSSQYITSVEQQRLRPVYVGGRTATSAGTTSNYSIGLFGTLTGGIGTSPQTGDIVIVVVAMAVTASLTYRISGFTEIANLYANDDEDIELQVGYKIMGASPDTSVIITAGSGGGDNAISAAVHVWRGVDATTPLDVTPTTVTAINTAIPNPPAITPTTANSVILVAAGSAHIAGAPTFTAAELSNFRTIGSSDVNDSTVGIGSYDWVSGTFDPAAWTYSVADNTINSTASVTFALRPSLTAVNIYGNYKNSGIWNLTAQYDDRFYNYTPPTDISYVGTPPGTYYLTIPPGVTEISAVVVGGGGGGAGGESGRNEGVVGGGGGGLAYGTFAVTPGEILTVVIGSGGNGGTTGNDGSPGTSSQILRGATVLLQGGGGQGGLERSTGTRTGGTSTGTERDGGGSGGSSSATTETGGGGGGAGGYSGNGGNGGSSGAGTSGAGGGGGGGGATNSGQGYGGGGTNLYGEGTSGAGGALNNPGFGGSFGDDGTRPDGGYPGGGGGACDDDTNGSGGRGGDGAAFIIWGPGRSYPSNTGLL